MKDGNPSCVGYYNMVPITCTLFQGVYQLDSNGKKSAALTGLEPAISAVTGRCDIQLRYKTIIGFTVSYEPVPPTGFEPVISTVTG